jgi:peptide deformylase
MILPIVKYGHPALRQKGARIEHITPALRRLITDMLETMHAAAGVGLAAQQVAQPLQLTVLDVREVQDRPSTLEIGGQPAPVADHMPLVLVNPEFKPTGEPVAGPEGCLSFPEMYADIIRPESVEVRALDGHGKPIGFRCAGLLARAIQHEYDHLHGILFIDRMDAETKKQLKPDLDALQAETKSALKVAATAKR